MPGPARDQGDERAEEEVALPALGRPDEAEVEIARRRLAGIGERFRRPDQPVVLRQTGGGPLQVHSRMQVPAQGGAQQPRRVARQRTVPQQAFEAHGDGAGGTEVDRGFARRRELVPARELPAKLVVERPALGIGVARRRP